MEYINRIPAHPDVWWTVDEFAERTRRTPAAVRASIARGELPAVRIGRRWFIDPAYFERRFAIAARTVEEHREANQ